MTPYHANMKNEITGRGAQLTARVVLQGKGDASGATGIGVQLENGEEIFISQHALKEMVELAKNHGHPFSIFL